MNAQAPSKPLSAAQARRYADAHRAVEQAAKALEDAKALRVELLEQLRDRLPAGEFVEAGGIKLKRSTKNTGRKFSLSAYLAKGHKVTKEMRPFVGKPSEYEVVSVKVIDEEASNG